jgi:hypothetical protein
MYLFAVPMDARTCHFHRTVGYLENGRRKIPIFKSNNDGDEEDDDNDVDNDNGDNNATLRRVAT